jgi:hypothetical protein
MTLATSPIRCEDRERELRAWAAYKLQRHIADARRKGKRFGRARLLSSHNRVIDLRGAWLDGICVGTVDLRGVLLDGASLRGAWLKGAHCENASMKGVDFSPLEGSGVPGGFGWGNARLGFTDFTEADMEGAILSNASLVGATLRDTVLNKADLRGADLSESTLVRTKLLGTTLIGARIYGISAWDLELCGNDSLRRGLIVTPESDPPVFVDDVEIAQFIHLLLSRPKLRRVINAVTERGVLILGRFRDGGLELLEAVADKLRDEHYLPMIFDFDRPDSRDCSETVKILAGLARFIVADISGGSVPHELASNVPFLEVPVVAILNQRVREYSMFRDLFKYPWVVRDVVRFSDVTSLRRLIPSHVIAPAEAMVSLKRARLKE